MSIHTYNKVIMLTSIYNEDESTMSIFNDIAYWEILRAEVFDEDPLDVFIRDGLTEDEQNTLFNNKLYWFVCDNYDWDGRINSILEGIAAVCEEDKDYYGSSLLIQVWNLLPEYMDRFGHFHPDVDTNSSTWKFDLMHDILVGKRPLITEMQLTDSCYLRKSCFLSLDTGFITKLTYDDKSIYQLASKSLAKLVHAKALIQSLGIIPINAFINIH